MVKNSNEIERGIVLFDGECNFCNSTLLHIIKYNKKDKIRFASLQREIGIKILNENGFRDFALNTMVIIKEKRIYIKTDALIEVCKLLVGFPRVFIVLKIISSKIRNYFYDVFSKCRYDLFGKKTEYIIPNQQIIKKFLV
jgi:predicted DCC family thiol-disulfide oxidoreductase YuxK